MIILEMRFFEPEMIFGKKNPWDALFHGNSSAVPYLRVVSKYGK